MLVNCCLSISYIVNNPCKSKKRKDFQDPLDPLTKLWSGSTRFVFQINVMRFWISYCGGKKFKKDILVYFPWFVAL